MIVRMKARRDLNPKVIRMSKKSKGIKAPAVLKSISNDRDGRGETFNTRPRKRLKRGGCECR